MARPRDTELERRETSFRLALIDTAADIEQSQARSGIADAHVVRLLNRDDWLALVTALRAGAVGPIVVKLAAPLADAA